MSAYVYDLECFNSLFTATFIPASKTLNDKLVTYEQYDTCVNGVHSEFLISDKIKYIESIGGKIFIVEENNFNLRPLVDFINQPITLYGYNNHDYDDLLLNTILLYYGSDKCSKKNFNTFIKGISNDIIEGKDKGWDINTRLGNIRRFNAKYFTVDLQKLNHINTVSLKFIAVLLKHYRIQDLPYEHTKSNFSSTEISNVIDYNINDVLITKKLLHYGNKELKSRLDANKLYGLYSESYSRSKLATEILAKYYKQISGRALDRNLQTERYTVKFSDIIPFLIVFRTDKFKELFSTIFNTTIRVGSKKRFTLSFIHNDVKYNFATGGIHSEDRPKIITATDEFDIIDADVSSYYPTIIINNGLSPEHIPKKYFVPTVKLIRDERLDSKHKAKDRTLDEATRTDLSSKADILKIVVNIIFGKLGDEYSPFYDMKIMYAVTITGQLSLMMLVEELTENGFQVISANTDGILSKVPKDKAELYYSICNKWSEYLDYELEFVKYKKYIGRDVNNYIAIKEDDSVKEKGIFTKDKTKLHDYLKKGYNMPIISIALYEYFVNNKPIIDTIKNHKDIHDFFIAQKIGRGYSPKEINLINFGEDEVLINEYELQHTIRFYASKSGSVLIKSKSLGDNKERSSSLLKKQYVTIMNDLILYDDFKDYNINYLFYIKQTQDIIDDIHNLITKKLKNSNKKQNARSGTLFD